MRGPLAAINLVSHDFGVGVREILGPGRRSGKALLARQVATYLVSVGLDLPPRRVAAAFRCHHSTVELGLGLVEDRRDDPAFDARVEWLTDRLRLAAA